MAERVELVNWFYGEYDEDTRLDRSRQGQMEYITTMEYAHRYLTKESKILEIGAGTGRYSINLAKEGYDVTAVELVEKNLNVLKSKITDDMKVQALQGDATKLQLDDQSFDLTLVLGPMYHLYDAEDVHKAIDEAIRVTKKGGVIIFAFISMYAIVNTEYLYGNWSEGRDLNFTEDFKVKHFVDQMFTGYDVCEFEDLFIDKDVEWLKTVAADGMLECLSHREDFHFSEEDFKSYVQYHLAICEKRELLGPSNHLLYICKRK